MKRLYLTILFLLSVFFLPAQIHFVWITAVPDTIYFDDNLTFSTIQVLVEDDDNNPVVGAAVYFDSDIGSVLHYIYTDEDGIAETNFWESCDLGIATITAECNANYLDIQVTIIMPVSTQEEEIPVAISNLKNYPNPFNPSTTIEFSINSENIENVEIVIYNSKGQKVRKYSIFNSQSSIVWNGTDQAGKPVSSGVYFYRIRAGEFEKTKKMLLMK